MNPSTLIPMAEEPALRGPKLFLIILVLGGILWVLSGREAARRAEGDDAGRIARLVQLVIPWLALGVGLDVSGLLPVREIVRAIHQVIAFEIYELAGTPVTLATLVTVVAVFQAARWTSAFLQRALRTAFHARAMGDEGAVAVLERLLHYSVMLIGVSIGLQTAGFNLGALFAASAVFAVGLGFGLQNVAQNFVSGIMLLVERSIKPGDVLLVDGELVRVIEMGIRSTIARKPTNEDLIIPNSKLVESTVTNFTLSSPVVRIEARVGVSYESDLQVAMRALKEGAERTEGRLLDQEPVVVLLGFGDSSVDLAVWVWTDDVFRSPLLISNLNMALWDALHEAKVVIPFPQIDLHLAPPVERAIAAGANARR